jgi:hypothetical protein
MRHSFEEKNEVKYFAWVRIATVCLLLALLGCGGGKSQGTSVISSSQGATGTATLALTTANLQLNGTTNVTATFLDLSGKPIAGLPVTFNTSLGSLNPSSGTAITDATGSAAVQLIAGGNAGTGLLTASATVGGVSVSKVASFAVAFPTITLSAPVLGVNTPLAPGGSTSVTVQLKDSQGNPFTTPVDVSFSSNFASTGKASLITPVRSAGGTASSTYTANGGVGTDTITVSVGGTSVTTAVSVLGTTANSISFVSATPTNITLKGMGGLGSSETSSVVFKVLDTNGQPKAGQTVDFSLNTAVGGLSLTSTSASSDQSGNVSTTVQAGIVATPVRVTATIHGSSPVISTQSDQLVVSTGIPTQNAMSLAIVTHNVEAYSIDGITDQFTVYLADHFGNPVPDGTAVNFSAQVGQVTPSCTTTNGRCTATWTSSGTRTPDGKVAILAYAVGEESFVDTNGNGVADSPSQAACLAAGSLQASVVCGEFTDATQAWRDDSHTGVYAGPGTAVASFPGFLGDFFVDFNGSGVVDRDGIFNGILRPSSVTGPNTKHVFVNNVFVMSTSGAKINALTTDAGGTVLSASPDGSISVTTGIKGTVQDLNTLLANPMASGTQIALSTQGTCLTVSPSSFTVPNTVSGPTPFSAVVTNTCTTGAGSPGVVTVTVTSPVSNFVTTKNFPFTW